MLFVVCVIVHLDMAHVITVRVHPNAKRTKIKETMADGSLKIDIAAPADDGKANAELIRFLAEYFGASKNHIEILSGHTSRQKMVRISG